MLTKIFLSVYKVTDLWSICIIGVSDTCTTFAGQYTVGRMCGFEGAAATTPISFNVQAIGVVSGASVCGK